MKVLHKKKYSILLVFVVALFFLGLWYFNEHKYSLPGSQISNVSLAQHVFRAEIVSSDKDMQRGLGGRIDMCQSCAMLFRFFKPGNYSFWMKGMLFPLDIIWVANGKIVHIEKNIQPDFSGTLASQTDADMVVEINAGLSDKYGLMENDHIVLY